MTDISGYTVPVILKHGAKRLQVNCFLDEGSDTTYVNEDVVEELGLEGRHETYQLASNKRSAEALKGHPLPKAWKEK